MTLNAERPASRQPIPPDAKKVFVGKLFDVYQWEQVQFDGSVATFEKLRRPDTVVVIPVLPNRKLLLIEEEQPGRTSSIAFPGGRLDSAEERPEHAAHRELLEETGLKADELILWKAIQPVTKIDWAIYFFIARACKQVAVPHLDAGERITAREATLDELFLLLNDPTFSGSELREELLAAKYDAEARAWLERTLFGE